jgi:signal transduction histidine kinase
VRAMPRDRSAEGSASAASAGVNIVREAAEQMGARLVVESEVAVGSTFRI